jgi:hypothetical protein
VRIYLVEELVKKLNIDGHGTHISKLVGCYIEENLRAKNILLWTRLAFFIDFRAASRSLRTASQSVYSRVCRAEFASRSAVNPDHQTLTHRQ